MSKKNKIIQRTISLMLCMALLFSSVNILGLFNNISAVEEETTTPDDSPENRVIQKFYDENIVINISSINEAEMYLPSTIRVLYNTGIEEVIDVFDWTQIKDCGVDENNIHTYYFEGKIDENYKVSSDTSLPIATVNIVDSNKLEISEDILTDYGNYFDWLNKIEAKEEVCPNCFRPLQDGTCSECLKNDCDCEEIDIDLTNLNSIEAWSNKYAPYATKIDETFYETRILFYDNDWWNNLKPNQKEVAERIYSHVIYNHTLYNGTQFADATVSDLLVFVKNNRTGMSNLEALHYFFPDSEAYVREDILEKLIELDPNMPIKCMYGMHTYVFFNNYYNKDIFGRQVSPLAEYWNNDEKLEKLYYVALMFEETNVATALNKNIKSTINTSLLTDKRNYIQKTKKTTVNTAKATGGNTITLSETPKTKYGIEHIYKTNDSSTPLTFCLNHGKKFKANVAYEYAYDENNKIGGIAKDIMDNHSNPEGSDTDLQYYAAAQQAIWALIGSGNELDTCDERSDLVTNGSSGVRPSMGATVSGYALKYYDEAPAASYSVYKISSTCVDSGFGVDDYQPMLILESPPPDPIYHAEDGSQDKEINRNRLVVKHNLTSSNGSDISDKGTNIIGTWKPDNSTLWTLSKPYATICGSSSWFEDSATNITEKLNFNFSFGLAEEINAFSCCDTSPPLNAWYSFDKYSQSFSQTGKHLSNSQLKAASTSPFSCIKNKWKNRHYKYGPNSYSLTYNYNTPHSGYSASGYSGVGVKYNDKSQVTDIQFGKVSTSCYYTTFKTNYSCDASSNTTHKVYKPKVTNYTLKLYYQGGWVTSDPTTYSTYSMNNTGSNFNYSNVTSFDLTHNATNKETYNNYSTEKTNVQFTDASVNNYKLTEYKTTKTSGFSGNTWTPSSNYFKFKHSDSSLDGVTTLAEFKYKNYYIVSLPTPVRTGYNFLGWFTESEGGTQVLPQTITATPTKEVYGTTTTSTFTNAYVIKADTTLYAHWELITKNEEFTVDWLDNGNSYTTRPKAILVELYRYANNKQDNPELCKGYISENVTSTTSKQTNWRGGRDVTNVYFTPDTNDWVYQFHNDLTGATVTKTDPNIRPTNTQNDVFYNGSSYVIKISPDDSNTSGTYSVGVTNNQWKVTLNNLQKYDTYQDSNHEYTYVIKAYTVESADTTTQYYISKNTSDNDYSTSADHYYNIQNNRINPNGQKTQNDYNNIAKKNLTKNLVCRLYNKSGNVAGEVLGTNPYWKSVNAIVTFKDVTDRYHFRPYSMIAELYQNIPNRKDTSQNNMMTDNSGVRTKVASQPIFYTSTNAYSSVSVGTITNVFFVSFKYLPTVQPTTCEKITYDVILTSGQDRYRYTIDSNSQYNNINEIVSNSGTSHDYAYHHKDITILNPYSVDNSVAGSYTGIASITDLNYNKMMNSAGNVLNVIDTVYIGTTTTPQYTYAQMKPTGTIYRAHIVSAIIDGYEFVIDNTNGLYQSILNFNDYTLKNNGQYNTYSNGTTASVNKSNYQGAYKSCAYNLRYYYITETINMHSNPNVYYDSALANTGHGIEQLNYMETLLWNFTVTLNGSDKTLSPTEYSGSNSADDRTGNYNGTTNDDYTHTNNKLTITSNVKNQSGNNIYAENEAYKKLQIDQNQEGFLITLKQIKKNWTGSGDSTGENYTNNSYSKNGYIYYYYDTSRNRLTRIFQPEATTPSGIGYTSVGNEYNVYVPANGSTTLEYLPDGKYEVTCHYDIDFSNFTFKATTGKTASITKESNGKYYLTFSSATVKDNQDITHSATIDYWRGYVDDMNNFSWARPLRDNNFGLVSGTPSNVGDKTLYPFGNNDKKNEVTYGTKDVIIGTGYHAHDNYDDKNPSLNPYSSISNYFMTKEYVLK